MKATRKRRLNLRQAAARVDFGSEQYYNISFGLGVSGAPATSKGDVSGHSLYEYQTELNRIRIELFRLQRNVKNLQMPALEVVGLNRVGEDIDGLRAEMRRLMGKVADVADLDPLRSAIEGFLEVADSCERVLESARSTDGIPESVLTGVEAIYRLLLARLKKLGVEPMPESEMFDPNRHMAMATVEDPAKPDGSISQVQLTGYTLGGRILRAAQVVVVRNRHGGNAETSHDNSHL
ncbi:nucleotide exchange factor GrpE [bacterium]|nr:nucleotide exchange factor GrpE [bacterium]